MVRTLLLGELAWLDGGDPGLAVADGMLGVV
jgi:hypothetical protein